MSRDDPNPGTPLFVERQTYRRRRLVDGVRALPVLGVALWTLPLLWAVPDEPMRASTALIYIFAVWFWLAVGAGVLVFALRRPPVTATAQEDDG
ncbi:MAG: hypothetical protein N4A61_11330 [Pelagimonas sp.]|jgi:hypothetical protein|nr:hypothetical protein [Pelagimonas sp.]